MARCRAPDGDDITIGAITATLTADPDPTTHGQQHRDRRPCERAPGDQRSRHREHRRLDAATLVKRLVVADTTGLEAPFSLGTPQQIAITERHDRRAGGRVLLVDGAKDTVVVQGDRGDPRDWTSFELLQVAGTTTGHGRRRPPASTPAASSSCSTATTPVLLHVARSIRARARSLSMPRRRRSCAAIRRAQRYLRTLEIDVLIYEDGVLSRRSPGLELEPGTDKDAFER